MTEEEKALNGQLFAPGDPALAAIKCRTHNLNISYNLTFEDESEKRTSILREILGSTGKNCRIQGPIYFHYGRHTSVGDNFFANFNLTIQDDAMVTIGNDCNFGPGVTIVTPVHPLVWQERNQMEDKNGVLKHLCYARPVKIGDNCWLAANVTVCPGVSIGNNCVIGAGSVVTRDIPPDSFAAGNPCRVIRKITEKDSMRYRPEILSDYRICDSVEIQHYQN